MDHFFKSSLNLLQYCFCYLYSVFFFFGCEACGILDPQPGIESALPVLEGKVLTTGLLEKSQFFLYFKEGYCRKQQKWLE